jgi:hypothetical protein
MRTSVGVLIATPYKSNPLTAASVVDAVWGESWGLEYLWGLEWTAESELASALVLRRRTIRKRSSYKKDNLRLR